MTPEQRAGCLALLAKMKREVGGAEIVNAWFFLDSYERELLTGANPNVREGRWYAHPDRDYRPRPHWLKSEGGHK